MVRYFCDICGKELRIADRVQVPTDLDFVKTQSLIQERWKTKEGKNQSKIIIQSDTLYLGSKKKEGGNSAPKFKSIPSDNSEPENQIPPSDDFSDDFPEDIPF